MLRAWRKSVLALLLGVSFPMAACRADVFVRDDIILNPTPQRFSVCHGNGCVHLSEVNLDPAQWLEILAIFYPPAANGAGEREQIRAAIAKFEQFAGAATDTWADRGRNAGNELGPQAGMDCIDESINTTLYITLLARQGLLRHHEVRDRATRGWIIFGGWFHTTAVIREIKDGSLWAVDSWFLDNGQPPFIVPLDVWRAGWEPEKP